MTRRLMLAILGTAVVALILAGLGTFVLSAAVSRSTSERAVTQQAVDVAAGYAKIDSGTLIRPAVADAIQRIVRLEGVSFLREDRNGKLVGVLPASIGPALLDTAALKAGTVLHGHRGRFVWAAAPTNAADGKLLVAVLARKTTNGLQPAWRWFVVTCGIVTVLGALVAVNLSRRLTRPIRHADAVARRIAAGELSARLPMPQAQETDELADLVRSVNSMAASLERSKAVEQQFLMSVSHDLRTPLTSIRGYAEAISDGAVTDAPWAAGVIMKESRRLERLVSDLLDLSKLQSRSFSLHLQPVDLSTVVTDAAHAFSGQAGDVGLTIHIEAPTPVMVSADRDRVAQILANLVENARKYATSTIVVAAREVGGVPMLWVDDDGPGIPIADRPHVFERLYRTSQRPERAENSSGLGLAIVAELAEAMGATAVAEESASGGARLVIRFATTAT